MGVKNGAKTLHSVIGLTLADVTQICKGLAAEQQILPRIVADCSNLLFVFSKCTSAVSAVAGHLSRIAATGVVMVPVCDGPIRPISKQETNKRIADKELSRIKAYHCRTTIVELKNRLAQESLNQAERDAITGEIRKLDIQMKRNETQSHSRMPNNFASELEYELNYNRREGYLQTQQEFQERDLVEIDGKLEVLPFLNVYDKGYRARTVAWKNGNQGVLQPTFAPSDRRFNGRETKLSASIASDRGGNERAVNVSKRAAYISRGFRPNMDSERFDIAWRTWNFKSNFMFKPVL